MTNREWLMEQMQNMSGEELVQQILCKFDICKSQLLGLDEYSCTVQFGKCEECYITWLNQEHQEIPKLSDAERVILENIDEKYKWIARNSENDLFIYTKTPIKREGFWLNVDDAIYALPLEPFNHLFQFIKWNDTEPYCIQDLLKGE